MPPRNDMDGGEDITVDLYPFIREYKGGRVERLLRSSFMPATEDAAANRGVATRDVVIDKCTGVSARLFLPSDTAAVGERIPVIMYVHGGSFCTESAFGRTYNNYVRSLAVRAGALVVSVEYRLAPEHPVPTAYDDAWATLQWVASLSDPWLSSYADLGRMFLAGDSAGGNIVYNTAVRAAGGRANAVVDIEGLVLVHPYFWGVDRLSSSDTVWDGVAMFTPDFNDRLWPYITAGQLDNDDPWINPLDEDIASLTCRRVLVAVAEKDTFSGRGCRLAARMRDLMWSHDENAVTLVQSEAEDHCFHLYNPRRATSKILMESIVQFVNQRPALPLPAALLPEVHELNLHACQGEKNETSSAVQPILGVPTRPYMDVFGYGVAMKDFGGAKNTTSTSCLQIGGQGRRASSSTRTSYGLFLGNPIRPNKRFPLSAAMAAPGACVFHNFI